MKAVILAGGLGTRLSEETHLRPKPMVEIGGMPILWHILKSYSAHGINDFIICCGYKGYLIKEYFANYFLHTSDVKVRMFDNSIDIVNRFVDPWEILLVDTGESTMTGGRLKKVRDYVGNQSFCFTYGDGVSDVDITSLITHHRQSGKLSTVTAVRPPGRYGVLSIINESTVLGFEEKPQGDGGWINGGFFVLEPGIFDRIEGPNTTWEQEPLVSLAHDRQLTAFKHSGFWQPMDTLRDRNYLESLWSSGKAPWKVWK